MNKTYAILSHLSGFLLGFLGPLIFFLIAEDEETKAHAREALNYQITLCIYLVISWLLIFVFVGLLLLPLVAIKGLICMIIAAVKAGNGEGYRYPLNIRFVK